MIKFHFLAQYTYKYIHAPIPLHRSSTIPKIRISLNLTPPSSPLASGSAPPPSANLLFLLFSPPASISLSHAFFSPQIEDPLIITQSNSSFSSSVAAVRPTSDLTRSRFASIVLHFIEPRPRSFVTASSSCLLPRQFLLHCSTAQLRRRPSRLHLLC